MTGERPPTTKLAAKIPDGCPKARRTYGLLFREGPGRTLADALVAVTGYEGTPKTPEPEPTAVMAGCAFDARTYALQVGKPLLVENQDSKPFIPFLYPVSTPINELALPKKAPVKVYAKGPGRYGLMDTTRKYVYADVFVLKYPTVAVTGIDGAFEIPGVPAGKLKISAVLPVIMRSVEKEITVEANKTTLVDLTVQFSAAAHQVSRVEPAPSAAAPGPSASASP